jgi:hypothetical protein
LEGVLRPSGTLQSLSGRDPHEVAAPRLKMRQQAQTKSVFGRIAVWPVFWPNYTPG